jgi:hypothetical protein
MTMAGRIAVMSKEQGVAGGHARRVCGIRPSRFVVRALLAM